LQSDGDAERATTSGISQLKNRSSQANNILARTAENWQKLPEAGRNQRFNRVSITNS
jgi:hypothetical protein